MTLFMNATDFDQFEHFLLQHSSVKEAYKVSGEGCYELICETETDQQLDEFLHDLLRYGRYKLASSIRCVK